MSTSINRHLLIRKALANFELAARIEPNQDVTVDRAFLPEGHRGVLDLRRQLIVGNRGMGKSFWTHALMSSDLRNKLADVYGLKSLKKARVEIGFNGSDKTRTIAPTTDEISDLFKKGVSPDLIWRGVFLRAAHLIQKKSKPLDLQSAMNSLEASPNIYSTTLSQVDDQLTNSGENLLIVFDALDRLGKDWESIRALTRSLLSLAVGLRSFNAIRAKIFMRVDQFSDQELFRFPDSSKIRNDHVNLIWRPSELYGLLLFEILRDAEGSTALRALARNIGANAGLPISKSDINSHLEDQELLVDSIAGEFMGTSKKRGRVYTWVPLHLSDAANTCSPRTFLIAWKKAAEHEPSPIDRAVDHLGLLDGVRSASTSRLEELYEDYPWIQLTLDALRRQFVPMEREQLFDLWRKKQVIQKISATFGAQPRSVPVGLSKGGDFDALLGTLKDVAVLEERSNGKINVPDIFRVEAEILRKGGVAVPRRF